MASKDLRPITRLGKHDPRKVKAFFWAVGLLACGGGGYAAYHYGATTEVEIPVARVRKGDFIIAVRTRGDIKSTRSTPINAPQAPGLRIVRLAKNGQMVKKGDVVVEFDRTTQEALVISRTDNVTQMEGNIKTNLAAQKMENEQYAFQKVQSEYALENAKLRAGRAAVLSDIEGEKARIDVVVSEGALAQVKTRINANQIGNEADLVRMYQARDKAIRDLKLSESYYNTMELRAPVDGVVNVLTNFRAQGTFGRAAQPPFKEGDNVWTGAAILEIPDISQMYIDLKLDEVDRGKIALGQQVKVRVDSIPDKEFLGTLDFISPAAALVFTGVGANQQASTEKNFPARATLSNLDDRLRPGTSASAEVIVEKTPDTLLIPLQASFSHNGKPAVYVQNGQNFIVRTIQIGKKNDTDVVVTSGLKEGEVIALEDPVKLARAAKKKKL